MTISRRIDLYLEGEKRLNPNINIDREGALLAILGNCGDYITIISSIFEELGIKYKRDLKNIANIIPNLEDVLLLAANMSKNRNKLLCIILSAIFMITWGTVETKVFDRLLNAEQQEYLDKLAELLQKYYATENAIDRDGLDLLTIKFDQSGIKYNKEYLSKYLRIIMSSKRILNITILSDIHKVVFAPTEDVAEYIKLILGLSKNFEVQPPVDKKLCEILISWLYKTGKLPPINELKTDMIIKKWKDGKEPPKVTKNISNQGIALPVANMLSKPDRIYTAKIRFSASSPYMEYAVQPRYRAERLPEEQQLLLQVDKEESPTTPQEKVSQLIRKLT